MPDLASIETLLTTAVPQICPAAQLAIYWQGELIFQRAYGWLDPATQQRATTGQTLFDLASLTKLFVATSFMRLVETGAVTLDQTVTSVLPTFTGERALAAYENPLQEGGTVQVVKEMGVVDASQVTFRHLLTHTAGLPAWRPLFKQATPSAARTMALATFFSAPLGSHIVYSDIGLILLGMAVEQLAGQSLATAVSSLVLNPLGLTQTRYLPLGTQACDPTTVAPTEQCQWRQRRVVAEVHDENAARLGGVAGHAGLFSTATEVAALGQSFLDGDSRLLQRTSIDEMRRVQATDGDLQRGLGFLLWSPDPEASSHPFSPQTFGHTGFTGTSLWIDPTRELVVALLTNEVYNGRVNRRIGPLRVQVHQAIVDRVDQTI